MFGYQIHPNTKQQLEQILASPAHAYLLSGPAYLYKQRSAEELAVALAAADSLADPNIYQIAPEEDGGKIKIAQVKALLDWLSRTAYYADRYRVVVVARSDTMTIDASNALLKMLEEPAEKVVFVLVSDNVDHILPTIRSRVQHIAFVPHAKAADTPPRLVELLAGDPTVKATHDEVVRMAKNFAVGSTTERFMVAKQAYEGQQAQLLVAYLQQMLRPDLLQGSSSASRRVQELIACEDHLRQNINPRLCLENLALEFAQ